MASYKSEKKKLTERKSCRICESKKLFLLLDLGETPLADLFVKNPRAKEDKFPLRVSVCKECFLVQLNYDVDDDLLFGDNYAFYTAGSPSSIPYFKSYADDVLKRFPKETKKFTLEIASNDGTLLKHFQKAGCKILGIDPAKNVSEFANQKGIETIVEFFDSKTAKRIAEEKGKAGIVIANNVIAHVTDPKDFLRGVKKILDSDGVAIIECQYFPYLLFNNQFDNVYHEHRSFFSLTPLNRAVKSVGLKLIDVEEYDTQGGSIRFFITHAKSNAKVSKKVADMLRIEKQVGLLSLETYIGFPSRINYIKYKLINILKDLKKQGFTIAGYGASAKSNTLLNYCGINTNYLDYILDETPYKFGLYTPGTHIPVVGKEKKRPDYYLLLVWNYSSGILKREEKFRKNGGKFIVAIPTPRII